MRLSRNFLLPLFFCTVVLVPASVRAQTRTKALAPAPVPMAPAPTSMLRIVCEGESVGAEIWINGKLKGDCPVDVQVAEGRLQVRAFKKLSEAMERWVVQEMNIGEGVVKRLEIVLPEARYSFAGAKAAAEDGNIQAMAELAERYRLGEGVVADATLAEHWLKRSEELREVARVEAERKRAAEEMKRQVRERKIAVRNRECSEAKNPYSDWRAPSEWRAWFGRCHALFPID